MIKHLIIATILLINYTNCLKSQDLKDYVNPLIGTDSKYEFSNGNTFPTIAMPWGMILWTPQTNK